MGHHLVTLRVWRNGRRGRFRICCLRRMSSSLFTRTILLCGSSSVVECHLAKVDVASPNLVYRSISAPWPSGKAKLCKSFTLQFESGWRLHFITVMVMQETTRSVVFLFYPDFANERAFDDSFLQENRSCYNFVIL